MLVGLGWQSGRDSTFSCSGEMDVPVTFPGRPLRHSLTDRKAVIKQFLPFKKWVGMVVLMGSPWNSGHSKPVFKKKSNYQNSHVFV